MKIGSYKDLEAYRKGYELVKYIYVLTRRFPKEELYGISSQMRRASISIPSNIAEGYMRGSKEYIQFLKVALGSCAELETQLSLSKDLGFCNNSEFQKAHDLLTEIMKLLSSYLRRMRSKL